MIIIEKLKEEHQAILLMLEIMEALRDARMGKMGVLIEEF